MTFKSSQAAIALIVSSEVSSEAVYMEKYQHPEWPGGMSGVTVGIGYDCGYVTPDVIAANWGDKLSPVMTKALEQTAGIKGPPASSHAHELFGIVTVPFDVAMAVFIQRDMPRWEAIVNHALINADRLSGDSFGSLTSLTYNRGASYALDGDRYIEMRNIRDLMAARQFELIPDEIRSMKRLWPKMPGLQIRRDKEADLFEKGLAA